MLESARSAMCSDPDMSDQGLFVKDLSPSCASHFCVLRGYWHRSWGGLEQRRQITLQTCGNDRVVGVELAVCKVISDAGDVLPRLMLFTGQKLRVGTCSTTFQRRCLGEHPLGDVGFQGALRHQIDLAAEEIGEFPLEADQFHQAHAFVEIHEQVHIARCVLVASGHAAEQSDIASMAGACNRKDYVTTFPHPLTKRRLNPSGLNECQRVTSVGMFYINGQLASRRRYQSGECRQTWLSPTALVSADHRLGYSCPISRSAADEFMQSTITDRLSFRAARQLRTLRLIRQRGRRWLLRILVNCRTPCSATLNHGGVRPDHATARRSPILVSPKYTQMDHLRTVTMLRSSGVSLGRFRSELARYAGREVPIAATRKNIQRLLKERCLPT